MTNFEYYADEIKAVGHSYSMIDGKIVNCKEKGMMCEFCIFAETGECIPDIIEWLYQEYKESPELTYNERMLCEVMNYEYLARCKNGQLVAFKDKPVKGGVAWNSQTDMMVITDRRFKDCNFSFIKWEDEEPWAVSDLKKLGVKEC